MIIITVHYQHGRVACSTATRMSPIVREYIQERKAEQDALLVRVRIDHLTELHKRTSPNKWDVFRYRVGV